MEQYFINKIGSTVSKLIKGKDLGDIEYVLEILKVADKKVTVGVTVLQYTKSNDIRYREYIGEYTNNIYENSRDRTVDEVVEKVRRDLKKS